MYVRAKNTSEGPVSVWWGVDNYTIPANYIATVPLDAFLNASNVRSLKGKLEQVGEPFHSTERNKEIVDASVYEASLVVEKKEAEAAKADPQEAMIPPPPASLPPKKPWELNADWDPALAPIDEVRLYVTDHGMTLATDDDDNRMNVVEHMMG